MSSLQPLVFGICCFAAEFSRSRLAWLLLAALGKEFVGIRVTVDSNEASGEDAWAKFGIAFMASLFCVGSLPALQIRGSHLPSDKASGLEIVRCKEITG